MLLQASASKDDDAEAVSKRKDKFLIQGIRIPNELLLSDGDEANERLSKLWDQADQVKKVDPTVIYEQKIKCVFVNAPPAAAATAATTTPLPVSNSSINTNTAITQPSSNPQQRQLPITSATTTAESASSSSTLSSSTPKSLNPSPAASSSSQLPHANLGASISSSSSSASAVSFEDLEKELLSSREAVKRLTAACEGYRAEIDRLNALRQRKAASNVENGEGAGGSLGGIGALSKSNGDLGVGLLLQQGGGVPVQQVGILVAIAFLLGILFF